MNRDFPQGRESGTQLVHAEVVGPLEKQWCRVRLEEAGEVGGDLGVVSEGWARIALAGDSLGIGDQVLLALGDGHPYVIGVLERAAQAAGGESGRAEAFREGSGAGERLGVRDERGQLLFEYRPAEGRALLSLPDGDLELRAGGRLDLVSGQELRVFSGRGVSFESPGAVELRSGEEGASALRLDGDSASLETRRFELSSESVELSAQRLHARAEDAQLEAGWARVVAKRLESSAERIVQRARSLQQTVEGLHQLVADRVLQRVRGSFLLRSGRLNARGNDGVKIDGDKIHLG